MKKYIKKITITFFIILVIGLLFLAYAQDNANLQVEKYISGSFYIELYSNGTFAAQNYITLEGRYRMQNEEIYFDIEKLNDNTFKNTRVGMLKDNILIGPDGLTYIKEDKP